MKNQYESIFALAILQKKKLIMEKKNMLDVKTQSHGS